MGDQGAIRLLTMALVLSFLFLALPPLLSGAQAEAELIGGGTQRVGLVEIFTAVWCVPCYNADLAIEELYNELGDTVAIVAYHPLTNGDPFGLNDTPQRFEYYLGPKDGPNKDLWGYPTQMINGFADPPLIGAPSVKSVVQDQKELLGLGAGQTQYVLTGAVPRVEAGNVTFRVEARGPAANGNLTLRVVLTEDNRYWWGTNGDGTPATSTNNIKIHRWVARQHLHPRLLVNGSLNRTFSVPMGDDWKAEEMGYVAFIQDEDTHEVLQALAYYPNPPVRAGRDGDSPGPGLPGLLVMAVMALVLMNMFARRPSQETNRDPGRGSRGVPRRETSRSFSRYLQDTGPRHPLMVVTLALASALLGLTVLGFTLTATADMTPTFSAAMHDPDQPTRDDILDITLWIDDTDDVTQVDMLVCSKTQNLCGLPQEMETTDNDTKTEWQGQNDWGMEPGHELGYKFTVKTENGTKHYFPDPDHLGDYAAYDLLDLSGDGDWYFAFQVQDEPVEGDDSPGLPLLGALTVVLGVALVLARRRR